jgi:hypothetical protein
MLKYPHAFWMGIGYISLCYSAFVVIFIYLFIYFVLSNDSVNR